MPDVWRIYRIKSCRHTNPRKDKFAVIVCKDVEYMGFLINSTINQYVSRRHYLLECQVTLSEADYNFLFHASFLDCTQLYPFDDAELVIGLDLVSDKTKAEIKSAVSAAKTIATRYKSLILNN